MLFYGFKRKKKIYLFRFVRKKMVKSVIAADVALHHIRVFYSSSEMSCRGSAKKNTNDLQKKKKKKKKIETIFLYNLYIYCALMEKKVFIFW
jgi:hypothetical protein